MTPQHQTELEEAFEEEFDVYNQQLLDERSEGDAPVVSHYADIEKLGVLDTAGLIINRMIGTGIFSTPSTVLKGTDSVGLSLLFWIIGALIAFAGLAVYLELGLTIPRRRIGEGSIRRDVYVPRSGGEKNYLEWIYKKPKYAASCVYAVVFIFLGNTSANSISVSKHILKCFNNNSPSIWVVKAYAVLTVTLACLLHGVWRAGGIYASNILSVFKIAILLSIIAMGFATLGNAFPDTKPETGNYDVDKSFADIRSAPYGYAIALLSVRFSYGGFENANYVLSDIRKPEETLKKSTMSAVGLVSILYIFTNISYLIVVSKAELLDEKVGLRVAAKFFEKIFPGTAPTRVLSALIALSAFGNIISVTFVSAKVKQEIAKEGVLPYSKFWSRQYKLRLFSRPTSQPASTEPPGPHLGETPIPALFLHWCVSVILVLSPNSDDSYTLLSNLYSYAIQACIGLLLAAGLLYKRYGKDGRKWRRLRGFTPWLGPLLPVFSLIANAVMVCLPWVHDKNLIVMKKIPWFVSPTVVFSLFGAGFVYWAVFRYAVPAILGKVLNVKRIPYFDRDVFVLEAVYSKWVIRGGTDSDVEEDIDLL